MAASFVTINGLRLDVDGFVFTRDLTPLMQRGPLRGENFTADGVAGSTALPKVRDELVALLPLVVLGENSSTGLAHADRLVGLKANCDEIEAACVTASEDAPVTAVLTFPDASTLSASVQCTRLDVGMWDDSWQAWKAVLEIVIPAGALT